MSNLPTTTHLITTCHYLPPYFVTSCRVRSFCEPRSPLHHMWLFLPCVTFCNTFITLLTTHHPLSYHMSPCASLATRHTFRPKAYTLCLPPHRISISRCTSHPVSASCHHMSALQCHLCRSTSAAPSPVTRCHHSPVTLSKVTSRWTVLKPLEGSVL